MVTGFIVIFGGRNAVPAGVIIAVAVGNIGMLLVHGNVARLLIDSVVTSLFNSFFVVVKGSDEWEEVLGRYEARVVVVVVTIMGLSVVARCTVSSSSNSTWASSVIKGAMSSLKMPT